MKEVLPITIKLLREKESQNRQSKLEQLQAAGKEGDDGDADDSEFFHLAHSKAQVFENLEKNASEILSEVSPLEPQHINMTL